MDAAASPTARALLTLELLHGQSVVTADRLAAKLGVSGRAARRYVGILRAAGIPVESTRGPYGGYRLGRGLRLPPLTFTAAEALGVVMAVLDGHHDPADPTDVVGSALGKILRALPEPVAGQAAAVRRTTAPAPDRGAARPDPATTATLVQACVDRRAVRLAYRTEAGDERAFDVDPWAVVVRHGRWYLLCWSRQVAGRRAYRVDRVTAVQVGTDRFTPPADLDPVADLEAHLAEGWEYAVEVQIAAPPDAVGWAIPRTVGRLEQVDAGTTRLVGSTSNLAECAHRLAAIPAPFRVLGCPELRAAVAALARRLTAAAAPAAGVVEDGAGGVPARPGRDRAAPE